MPELAFISQVVNGFRALLDNADTVFSSPRGAALVELILTTLSPVTHFLGSWLIACGTTDNARDRKLVTLAGVLPDVDGLGLVVDVAQSLITGKECTYRYYQTYHHLLAHGWLGALLISAVLACFARSRLRVLLICIAVYHLHFVCDLLGSRGPDPADLWPICYNEPLFRHPVIFWKHQWRLDGWQNRVITVTLFLTELWFCAKRGYSCVEVFSPKADRKFIEIIRKWRGLLTPVAPAKTAMDQ